MQSRIVFVGADAATRAQAAETALTESSQSALELQQVHPFCPCGERWCAHLKYNAWAVELAESAAAS